jgi:tetratricopeptide (TPR) repeat protein
MHQAPIAFALTLISASIAAVVLAPEPSRAADAVVSATQTQAVASLLRQAQFLTSHNRADLARGVLQKLLAVQPDHEGALLMLGDLELRASQNAAAQSVLERLQRTQPDSPATREMEALWQLYTTDRLRLTQLRQLRAGGRTAQARTLARQLFPNDVPPGSLAGEFAELIAGVPGRREVATQALAQRVDRIGAPRDRLALHTLQTSDKRSLANALRGFAQLAQDRSVPAERLVGPWSDALAKARSGQGGKEAATLANEQQALYERTMPSDLRVAQSDRRRSSVGQEPGSPVLTAREQGYIALSERKHDEAEAGFREALRLRPQDASARAGLGIIRLREGRYAEARQWLEQAASRESDAQARKDWLELAASARYWDHVSNARQLLNAQQAAQASRLLEQAIPLQPSQTEATVLLAGLRAEQGQAAQAEALYSQVLAVDPRDSRALRGRLALGLRDSSGKHSPDTLLDQAQAQAAQLNVPVGELIDAGALRFAADAQLAQQHGGVALRLLERGVAAQGQDPWLRHDLARLYLRDGLPAMAQSVMDEGVAQAPNDPQMRYAAALIALSADREEDALAQLAAIAPADRDDSQATLASNARFELAMRQYRAALAKGDRSQVQQALQTAEQNQAALPSRSLRLARAELGTGMQEAARQRLDSLDTARLSFAEQLSHAELQAELGRNNHAEQALNRLASQAQGAEQATSVMQAQERVATQRIEKAIDAGHRDEAQRVAGTALQAWPANMDAASTLARALSQSRLWLAAASATQALQVLDQSPRPAAQSVAAREWQALHVQALAATGQRDTARQELQALQASSEGQAPADNLRPVTLASDIGETQLAAQWLAPLLKQRPTDPEVRLEAARQSRQAGRYNEAMAHLRAASAAPITVVAQPLSAGAGVSPVAGKVAGPGAAYATTNTPVTDPAVQRAIAALDERRQPRVEVGWMQSQRSGDPGVSDLHAREIPVVVTWPVGWQGHVFGQVDAVKLDAGVLPGDYNATDTFGTVLARPAGTPAAVPLRQHVEGANLGGGWIDDRQRLDFGVIGLGMPVRNWVGGWQRSYTRGQTDISAEVARRVEARGLLPYAGQQDPITGAVWGGVTQTFGALRLARPLNDIYNLSSTFKLGFYDGQHVQRNRAWQWRSVVDRDVIRSEPLNLNVGVAAMLWRFQNNSSYYTYGHGGYYSPQRYFSVAVPFELTGRQGTWSYLLRASVSHSWTHENEAPYYPLDPALQTVAGDPRYSGGAGGGFGGSLRAAIEKQVAPQWSIGAWLDIDRSQDYAPNRGMIYLRHYFKPQGLPVPSRPQPVVPYSQF